MPTTEALPDAVQATDGLAEMQRAAGQADGIHRPCGGTDYHGKRVAGGIGQQVGDGAQHAHLVGRPRTTTGENQPGHGLLGGGAGIHGLLSGQLFRV
ncbi:hypothetical protein D3C72_2139470 [compost metagenome]